VPRNVERFLRFRDERRPELYANLRIIKQREATAEIEAFKAFWRTRGASSVWTYKLMEPTGDNPAARAFTDKFIVEKRRSQCSALWEQCFVYSKGEVWLCCTTLSCVPQGSIMAVGNHNQNSLREIGAAQTYQEVRKNVIFERFDGQRYRGECDVWSQSYQYREKRAVGTARVHSEGMSFDFFPNRKDGTPMANVAALDSGQKSA
jgi:Iron-sulfur cluster-binding domain